MRKENGYGFCRAEEEHAFKAFATSPDLHARIFGKMAPNIFGHDNIKKALASLLFGGARKVQTSRVALHRHHISSS